MPEDTHVTSIEHGHAINKQIKIKLDNILLCVHWLSVTSYLHNFSCQLTVNLDHVWITES